MLDEALNREGSKGVQSRAGSSDGNRTAGSGGARRGVRGISPRRCSGLVTTFDDRRRLGRSSPKLFRGSSAAGGVNIVLTLSEGADGCISYEPWSAMTQVRNWAGGFPLSSNTHVAHNNGNSSNGMRQPCQRRRRSRRPGVSNLPGRSERVQFPLASIGLAKSPAFGDGQAGSRRNALDRKSFDFWRYRTPTKKVRAVLAPEGRHSFPAPHRVPFALAARVERSLPRDDVLKRGTCRQNHASSAKNVVACFPLRTRGEISNAGTT